MKQRWLPVAVLAGGLFVINAVARLVIWGADIVADSEQTRIGFITFGAISLVCVAAGAWWAVQFPLPRAVGELLLAGGVACLLSVLVGPLFSGTVPFAQGFGFVLGQIVQYMALAGLGAALGFLGVTAVGLDWKTKELRRHEATFKANRSRSAR